MAPVIRISDETWGRLKKWAEPLEDSPDDALRKVLDAAKQSSRIVSEQPTHAPGTVVPTRRNRDRPGARQPGGKLPRGVRTPEAAYYRPLLETLYELGGSGIVRDVYQRVGERMATQFTDVDYQPYGRSGQIRWRNVTQWARNHLVETGYLRNDSPRGVWSLSDQGVRAVKNRDWPLATLTRQRR